MGKEFDKLVRDKIPEVIREDGQEPKVHHVDGVAYADRLVEKLVEEVTEYRQSRETEELADILEVVHAIRNQHGLTNTELQQIRAQKAADHGRFADGVVLDRVEE